MNRRGFFKALGAGPAALLGRVPGVAKVGAVMAEAETSASRLIAQMKANRRMWGEVIGRKTSDWGHHELEVKMAHPDYSVLMR